MTTALQADAGSTSTMAWSIFTGIYMFIVGVTLSSNLYSILSVFAEVIGLHVTNFSIVFASPAFVFGAGAWWGVVERRDAGLYRHGVIVGGATALLTGLVWTIVFVAIWEVEMLIVPMNAFLIALVLCIAVLVGGLAGLPLMFVRHQVNEIW
ncbi:hypothetical protein DJ69_08100 [Halorubrum persicum]|uniref:Uncharacterized protein n=1 Tax=Halorubrum persicum TaxID=1383844 RepID=A0A2G1WJB2_9EURY|nr:hypothetical protein [Halorubrum persicum]PHQ39070.1 hypothetical protein DJ69_08100 [Halorubrum persicum]